MDDTGMTLQLNQRPWIEESVRRVHAEITLSAPAWTSAAPSSRAEVLLLDRSTSMGDPPNKLRQARQAATEAIRRLPDGVEFAVVLGNHETRLLYPAQGLTVADDGARDAAVRAVHPIEVEGGTRISAWLGRAHDLLAGSTAGVRHAVLLTDGRNEHDELDDLTGALTRCAGSFVCDALGFGHDYDPDAVLRVADGLGGTAAAAVPEDKDLGMRFHDLMERAGRAVRQDVTLRIAPTEHVTIASLHQASPRRVDETPQLRRDDDGTARLATGTWASGETKIYHLTLDVAPTHRAVLDVEVMLAEVGLDPIAGLPAPPVDAVRTRWTLGDHANAHAGPLSPALDRRARLSVAFEEGMRAWLATDRRRARDRLSEALREASEIGAQDVLDGLAIVVERDADGGVVLRPDATPGRVRRALILSRSITSSPTTVRPAPPEEAASSPAECPHCHERTAHRSPFCRACGRPLDVPEGP